MSDQGRLDEAASMKREALEKSSQILGVHNPETLTIVSNLAVTLSDQNKLDEAATMQVEL
jgi:hypothetical protein